MSIWMRALQALNESCGILIADSTNSRAWSCQEDILIRSGYYISEVVDLGAVLVLRVSMDDIFGYFLGISVKFRRCKPIPTADSLPQEVASPV